MSLIPAYEIVYFSGPVSHISEIPALRPCVMMEALQQRKALLQLLQQGLVEVVDTIRRSYHHEMTVMVCWARGTSCQLRRCKLARESVDGKVGPGERATLTPRPLPRQGGGSHAPPGTTEEPPSPSGSRLHVVERVGWLFDGRLTSQQHARVYLMFCCWLLA